MNKIGIVLFDVGNVITRATHTITHAIMEDLGVPWQLAERCFTITAYGEFARGKITGKQFAEAVRLTLEAPWLTDEQIRAAHDAHIYMVDEEVVQIFEILRMARVPLRFVTTANEWQTKRERALIHLQARFGRVVRSHKIGLTKTDEGAWQAILKVLNKEGADPSTILLVDDALANIKAAQAAGFQTHLYDPTPVVGVRKLRETLCEYGLLREFR